MPICLNKKSFLYNAAILAVSNTFLQLLGFVYRIVLSRWAGPEGMGIYTLVMQMYTIVIAVCLSGVSIAVTTLTSRLQAQGNLYGIRRLVRVAIITFLVLFVLISLPVLFAKEFIATDLLGDDRTIRALQAVLLCIFLTGFENILKAVFHGAQRVKFAAVSELGEQLLRIGFVWLLLYKFSNQDFGYTAYLIFLGMILSEVYSVVFLSIAYIKVFVRRIKKHRDKNASIGKNFMQIVLPSAGTAIVSNLFASISTILFPMRLVAAGFTRSASVSALGVISGMATPLLMLPFAFIGSLCTVLLPSVAASAALKDRRNLQRKIRKGMQVTGMVAFPCIAILLPLVPSLCQAIFGQEIGGLLALLLAIQTIMVFYQVVSVHLLNGIGEQSRVLLYAVVGEGLELALIWILVAIPSLNIYGYILAMILGNLVRFSLNLYWIRRRAKVHFSWWTHLCLPLLSALLVYFASSNLFRVFTAVLSSPLLAALCTLLLCMGIYVLIVQLLGVGLIRYVSGMIHRS